VTPSPSPTAATAALPAPERSAQGGTGALYNEIEPFAAWAFY